MAGVADGLQRLRRDVAVDAVDELRRGGLRRGVVALPRRAEERKQHRQVLEDERKGRGLRGRVLRLLLLGLAQQLRGHQPAVDQRGLSLTHHARRVAADELVLCVLRLAQHAGLVRDALVLDRRGAPARRLQHAQQAQLLKRLGLHLERRRHVLHGQRGRRRGQHLLRRGRRRRLQRHGQQRQVLQRPKLRVRLLAARAPAELHVLGDLGPRADDVGGGAADGRVLVAHAEGQVARERRRRARELARRGAHQAPHVPGQVLRARGVAHVVDAGHRQDDGRDRRARDPTQDEGLADGRPHALRRGRAGDAHRRRRATACARARAGRHGQQRHEGAVALQQRRRDDAQLRRRHIRQRQRRQRRRQRLRQRRRLRWLRLDQLGRNQQLRLQQRRLQRLHDGQQRQHLRLIQLGRGVQQRRRLGQLGHRGERQAVRVAAAQ